MTQKREILLIEDNKDMVDQFRRVLQREGFSVITADHPSYAEAMVGNMQPTLLVMDVNFAKGEGWDILERLKSRDDTADIPIVIVTLSDEEARRRGTQKTVLERRAPPTFDVLIEIQDRQRLKVHHSVAASVDALLRGRLPEAEVRFRDSAGQVRIESPAPKARSDKKQPASPEVSDFVNNRDARDALPPLRAYPYGIARNRLRQAARQIRLPMIVVDDLDEADALITARSYYRRRPQVIIQAEEKGIPIHVLRSNTISRMENALIDLFDLSETELDPVAIALRETREAIRRVQGGARSIDLSPQNAYIRRRQHQVIRQSNLISHSYGKEPQRRVRIYRE